jgi:hypothetical protein
MSRHWISTGTWVSWCQHVALELQVSYLARKTDRTRNALEILQFRLRLLGIGEFLDVELERSWLSSFQLVAQTFWKWKAVLTVDGYKNWGRNLETGV